jgi:hypothetical protein
MGLRQTTEEPGVGAAAVWTPELCGLLGRECRKRTISACAGCIGEGLMRRRRRKRLARGTGIAAGPPQRSNQRSLIDCVSDCMAGGRTIRALTLVDDYTRAVWPSKWTLCLAACVRRVLKTVLEKRSQTILPRSLPWLEPNSFSDRLGISRSNAQLNPEVDECFNLPVNYGGVRSLSDWVTSLNASM